MIFFFFFFEDERYLTGYGIDGGGGCRIAELQLDRLAILGQ
jgi:hypothetical protein